jgi:hypothetical protein
VEAIDLYDKIHSGHCAKVKWGIGGIKRNLKRFMKRFNSTKHIFPQLFNAGCIMTNVLHRRHMDMNFEVKGMQHQMEQDIGCD